MRSARAVAVVFAGLLPTLCAAQDLTPRAYFPTPTATNAVVLTYLFSTGDIVFDPTVPITDSTGQIHAPVVSYYRGFSFFGRSANITGTLPFAFGEIRGKIGGAERAVHRAGMSDAVVRLAVNLRGGPARTAAEFVKAGFPRTMLGASLKVTAPTGEYDPGLAINIGTNRWAFKPELGFAKRWSGVVLEVYGGVWFFTANDEYFASDPSAPRNRRTQDPIGALEIHLSYDVNARLWIGADVNYWRGGRTSTNGVESPTTLQANSRLGMTGSVPLTRRQSLKVSYSDGVVVRVGGKAKILSVGYQYNWFGNPLKRD